MSANNQITFGMHAVFALVEKEPHRIKQLYLQKERRDQKIMSLEKIAQAEKIEIQYITKRELDKLSGEVNHQGAIAISQSMHFYDEHDLKTLVQKISGIPLLLILDSVQDPHNLGACFRTADAAGVHAIIVPKDKSASITPTVAKVASGAVETVPFVQVVNLVRTIKLLKELGVWVYGAEMDAKKTLYQTDLTGPTAIVLGSEGSGLRRLTRENCDYLLKIPMAGEMASLNVSVAAGIFLFEVLRQR